MKPKTMILMGVAVVCGLAASYMTSQLLAEREKDQQEQPTKEIVNMLVASKPLYMGVLVKEPKDCFTILPVEKGKEPANAFTEQDWEQIKDRRLQNRLNKGQFVFPEDLVDKNKNSMSVRLTKGMRAVGVKVDITGIAGGFASLPLSRVDIISVIRRGDGDSIAQTILEDVLVLAADEATQRTGDRNAMPANTVTVELSPDDAELLSLAQEMGTLRLILRPEDERKDNQAASRPRGVKGDRLSKGRGSAGTGRANEEKDDAGLLAGGSLIHSVVDVKDKKKPDGKREEKTEVVVEPPAPKTRVHVLTIYNGDQGTRYPFKVDLDGKIVTEEISQADAVATNPPPLPAKPKPAVKKDEQPKAPDPAPQGAGKKGKKN